MSAWLVPTPHRGNEAVIDCGSCRACCHQIVALLDDETGYDDEQIPTPMGVLRLLKRKPDGSCVYLTTSGCSIYAARPACCRKFDCGAWYRVTPRKLRKDMLHGDAQTKRLAKEGRRRAGIR